MKLLFITIVFCSLWLVAGHNHSTLAATFQAGDEKSDYVFGVFPFIPASRLEGIFAPLAKELSVALDKKVHYRSTSTFEKFMKRLENSVYDIALIQPFDYVRIATPVGYKPVARRWQDLRAVIAISADSSLKTIEDLKGKKISLPPEVSAVSYLGQVTLVQAGLIIGKDINLDFTKGHHAALQNVVINKSAAAVTSLPSLNLFQASLDLKLKILAKSKAIPQILFVVHDRVTTKDYQVIKQVLLETNLAEVPVKLRSWMVKGDRKPFIEATKSDYEIVRQMWQELSKIQ